MPGRMASGMELNPFKYCSGFRYLGYLMILVVFGIIAMTYWAVVVSSWGLKLIDGGPQLVLSGFIVLVFHILLILLTWSYFMVVFQDPGSVPENWRPVSEGNIEEGTSSAQSKSIPIESAASAWSSVDGIERRPVVSYCSRCQNAKPPRCHHCSVCQRCVLKMDHHCVWVVNCIGAHNYKFFLLFLWYTFLETTLDTLVLLPNIIKLLEKAKKHSGSAWSLAVTMLAFVLNLAFALSLLCSLVMHATLIWSNTTTIELYEKRREKKERAARWKFDLGWQKNFEQVFGRRNLLWCLPVLSKDDLDPVTSPLGTYFPMRNDADS